MFSFAVCRNKLNKWKTMHHKTDGNILRRKYDKDLATAKIRNDILTKKNGFIYSGEMFYYHIDNAYYKQ